MEKGCLELTGRAVAQRRVPPLLIVSFVNEATNRGLGFRSGGGLGGFGGGLGGGYGGGIGGFGGGTGVGGTGFYGPTARRF